MAASDDKLRSAGLSINKMRSLRDLSAKVLSKAVPLAKLHKQDDEEVRLLRRCSRKQISNAHDRAGHIRPVNRNSD